MKVSPYAIVFILVLLSYSVLLGVFPLFQVRYRARRNYLIAVLVLNLRLHGIEAVQNDPVLAPVLLAVENTLLSRLHREVLHEVIPGFQDTWRDLHLISKFYH